MEEFPDHPKALSSLGLALLQSQQYDEALKIYQSVARVSPKDPVPFERIAQLSERVGKIKEGMDAAMKAGELHMNNRDVNKAIEIIQQHAELSGFPADRIEEIKGLLDPTTGN